jgi:hypothetical protein
MKKIIELAIFGKLSAAVLAESDVSDADIQYMKGKMPYYYSQAADAWILNEKAGMTLDSICDRALELRTLNSTNR